MEVTFFFKLLMILFFFMNLKKIVVHHSWRYSQKFKFEFGGFVKIPRLIF